MCRMSAVIIMCEESARVDRALANLWWASYMADINTARKVGQWKDGV